MADEDQDRSIIIKTNPIGKGFDAFRASFNSVCHGAGTSCNPESRHAGADLQRLVHVFLRAAQNLPAADLLPAGAGRGTLRSDLLRLELSLLSDDSDLDRIKPLLRVALDVNAGDAFIWDQVRNAVPTSTPLPQPTSSALQRTPPRSISSSFDATPVVRSTSSSQGKEQTKKIPNRALLYELRGRIFRGVGGFFEEYFEGHSWTERCKSIYRSIKPRHVNGRWVDFPDPLT